MHILQDSSVFLVRFFYLIDLFLLIILFQSFTVPTRFHEPIYLWRYQSYCGIIPLKNNNIKYYTFVQGFSSA